MRDRCLNPNSTAYKHYGGRGISICPEWDSYQQFAEDMGSKPSPKHSLDRIDNDSGYSPSNCRWATQQQQVRNQRVTRRVTIAGISYLAVELGDIAGVKTDTIVERAKRGLSYAEVTSRERLSPPPIPPDLWKLSVASRAKKTHCPSGHPYDGTTKQGWRKCSICHRDKERIRQARKRN